VSTAPKPAADEAPSIAEEDVDDVIGHAEAIKKSDEGKLSLDDMKAVGRELDIEDRYVEKAVEKLEVLRREERAKEALAAARVKRAVTFGGAAFAVLLVVTSVMTLSAKSTLNASLSDVRAKRAQVHSVVERKGRVEALYQGRGPSPDRDAELLGAENRVRVEQKRYDEAAAKYNADAQGLGAGLATGMFGLPKSVPMSNEVTEW
jgi:hypothetical protein